MVVVVGGGLTDFYILKEIIGGGWGGVQKHYPSSAAQVQPHLIIHDGHQMEGGGAQ